MIFPFDPYNYPAGRIRGNNCIFDEMLNQVLEDKRKNRQWIAFSLEEVEADYVVNIDSQLYGVVAAIHLSQPYKAVNCWKAFN